MLLSGARCGTMSGGSHTIGGSEASSIGKGCGYKSFTNIYKVPHVLKMKVITSCVFSARVKIPDG